MHKTRDRLFKLVMTALLGALVVVLQFIVVPIGPFNITLTLIPIVFGAVALGPGYGTALGIIFGIIASILSISGRDVGGFAVFSANPWLAWALCLTKGAMAGLLPALIHKAFKNKKSAPWILIGFSGVFIFLAGFAVAKTLTTGWSVTTALVVCLTAIAAGAYLLVIRYAMVKNAAPGYLASMVAPIANTGIFIIGMLIFFRSVLEVWTGGSDVMLFIVSTIVGVNFVLEFAVSVLFAPAIAMAADAMKKRRR